MIDGRFELWYGLIIMGLGIPVFIHFAMKYIRDNRLRWKQELTDGISQVRRRWKEWRYPYGRRP